MAKLLSRSNKIHKLTSIDKTRQLILAVILNQPHIIDLLLKDDETIIDAVDDNGESALQMLFKMKDTHPKIIKKFLRIVQHENSNTEELVFKLYESGCTLYHAAFLGNIDVMQGLWDRGQHDIERMGFKCRTALHVAVDMNNLDLVSWLLDVGANVNAPDSQDCRPILPAILNGNSKIIKLLLDQGADPNVMACDFSVTPLILAMENFSVAGSGSQYEECEKLLVTYGAVPCKKSDDFLTIFYEALYDDNDCRINILTCHVVLLEMQGEMDKKIFAEILKKRANTFVKIREYYKSCQKMLETKVFKEITLLDLLSVSEQKFRIYMRNKYFYEIVNAFCIQFNEQNDVSQKYYYLLLNDRLERTPGVDLEQKAMSAICHIFSSHYNRCYVFAKEVTEYLNKSDLEQLCTV